MLTLAAGKLSNKNDLAPADLSATGAGTRGPGFRGFPVTICRKLAIAVLLDGSDPADFALHVRRQVGRMLRTEVDRQVGFQETPVRRWIPAA
jgi:hypothetical protein